jgi:exopolyphosphatase/guanosine-5'-triphosphate,3'-diphosphate pyrophosphatase
MDLSFEERSAIPSIGRERADLVMGGCAILEAMLETWPTDQLRVADRGLREGILAKLMAEDGFIKPGQSWTSQPKKSVQRRGRAKNSPRRANQSKKTRKK